MKSPCSTLFRLALTLSLTLALCTMLGAPVLAQAPANSSMKGVVEKIKVHGKSLEGNLEGDTPDRDVFIYLPPSYGTNSNQRYPVAYLLHGYGLTAERWMPFTKLADAADKNIASGTMKEMILVNPDAFTLHSGSMYSSSPTIGDWETYEGDHTNRVPERIELKVLPFFSNNLSSTAAKK